jgi:KaiC/GvpD/RAD55 family RecA-like ATPase/5S rRNA maturation endonuclease (ribonuclease M5)
MSSGKVTNIKKRSVFGAERAFMRLKGGRSDLLNQDVFSSGQMGEVILCEGESDTVALYSAGFQNVLGVSIGAKGFNPEWLDILDKISKFYICYDSDAAGQEGALQLAKKLKLEKSYRVILPNGYKDVNEYLMGAGTAPNFLELLNRARPFDVEGVKNTVDLVRDMIVKQTVGIQEQPGFSYPWQQLDRLAGRMCPGDLITVAGMPGVGKTNFSLYVAYILAALRGVPIMAFELEFPPEKLVGRLIGMHMKRDQDPLKAATIVELQEFHDAFKDVPFYFAYRHKPPTWESVDATIRESVRRYGIKFLVFDNIHYLVRSVSDQTKEVSFISRQFKDLAKELEIPIMLVARPRKTRGPITSQDIKDSSDIEGDSDTIILLNRRKNSTGETGIGVGTYSQDTAVNIDKARWGPGGGILLYALDAQARFLDSLAEEPKKTGEEEVPF